MFRVHIAEHVLGVLSINYRNNSPWFSGVEGLKLYWRRRTAASDNRAVRYKRRPFGEVQRSTRLDKKCCIARDNKRLVHNMFSRQKPERTLSRVCNRM